jgi:hypothetical protein
MALEGPGSEESGDVVPLSGHSRQGGARGTAERPPGPRGRPLTVGNLAHAALSDPGHPRRRHREGGATAQRESGWRQRPAPAQPSRRRMNWRSPRLNSARESRPRSRRRPLDPTLSGCRGEARPKGGAGRRSGEALGRRVRTATFRAAELWRNGAASCLNQSNRGPPVISLLAAIGSRSLHKAKLLSLNFLQ